MAVVLDYSFARPSPNAIKGVAVGVMRYLSGGANQKDLTAGERDELFAAGLEIGLVWETTAGRMNGGYPAGQADAQAANAQADQLGFPSGRPIYFANDQNAFNGAHLDYMRAARDHSARPVGPYGNTQLLDECAAQLGLRYGWKVSTWGAPTGNATLVQEANIPTPIAGTDVNSVHKDDWGQWHGASEEDLTPEQDQLLRATALRVEELQKLFVSDSDNKYATTETIVWQALDTPEGQAAIKKAVAG